MEIADRRSVLESGKDDDAPSFLERHWGAVLETLLAHGDARRPAGAVFSYVIIPSLPS